MFSISDDKNGRGPSYEFRRALEAVDADFFAHGLPRQEYHSRKYPAGTVYGNFIICAKSYGFSQVMRELFFTL